ncbi:MAG: hypothetical protein GY797_15340 [Deltaproteobacteria bacterium]|nr:hypothetical protein [Deltaproteobacteria bacterium]
MIVLWAVTDKLEELSDKLEELVLDAFIAVLTKLNDRCKVFFRDEKERDIQF